MAASDTCKEHTGCIARIDNIEVVNAGQWTKMGKMDARMNTILTRINIILGGIAASCVLLVINLVSKVAGG